MNESQNYETDDHETFEVVGSNKDDQHERNSEQPSNCIFSCYFHMQRVHESTRIVRLLCARCVSNETVKGTLRLTRTSHVAARETSEKRNEAVLSALQRRLCKIKAPILRGIEALNMEECQTSGSSFH
jgi:hypothetical protein